MEKYQSRHRFTAEVNKLVNRDQNYKEEVLHDTN